MTKAAHDIISASGIIGPKETNGGLKVLSAQSDCGFVENGNQIIVSCEKAEKWLAQIAPQLEIGKSTTETEASFLANELVGIIWSDAGNLANYATATCAPNANCNAWLIRVGAILPNATGAGSRLNRRKAPKMTRYRTPMPPPCRTRA
mgnify:CR=1 FL=1